MEIREPNGQLHDSDTLPQWAQKFIAHLQQTAESLRGQIALLKQESPPTRISIERTGPADQPVFLPEEKIRFKVGDDEISVTISAVSDQRTVLRISSERNALHLIPWCSNVVCLYSERL